MDDVDSDRSRKAMRERAPDWRGKPASDAAASRRPVWPSFDAPAAPTSWAVNLLLVLALCVLAMAIASAALKQWRQGVNVAAANVVTPQSLQAAALASSAPELRDPETVARDKMQ